RVWLFGEQNAGVSASASLASFTDAVCLPVGGYAGEPLAAVHAYRTGRSFTERDVQFLEAVSSFLAPAPENLRNRRQLEAPTPPSPPQTGGREPAAAGGRAGGRRVDRRQLGHDEPADADRSRRPAAVHRAHHRGDRVG